MRPALLAAGGSMRLLQGAVLFCSAASCSAEVRIGVFELFQPQTVQVEPAEGEIAELHAGGQVFSLEGTSVVTCHAAGEWVVCRLEEKALRGQTVEVHRRGGEARFRLRVPGRIERSFEGRLRLSAHAGRLTAVIAMPLERAVASAVAAEQAANAPQAALRAQAVVSRSYYAAGGRHRRFDFCDTTHCQFLRSPPQPESSATRAAAATRGLALRYQGRAVRAFYTRRCGGRTHTLEEIGWKTGGYPYHRVACEPCLREPQRWTRVLPRTEQTLPLASAPSEEGRIRLGRRHGWGLLPSNRYAARRQDGALVFEGEGEGHGVGLCQFGAARLAAGGMTWTQILSHYFPGVRMSELAAEPQP